MKFRTIKPFLEQLGRTYCPQCGGTGSVEHTTGLTDLSGDRETEDTEARWEARNRVICPRCHGNKTIPLP